MNKKISFIINSLIVILTVISIIMMFTGIKFMHGHEVVLESTSLGMFRFFTVQSNLFMGIVSLIYIISIQEKNHYKWIYILKLMATSSVSLTFFIVFTYLGPITKNGISSLFMNSNLFFHLIIPLLSIITFIFFERNNQLELKDSLYGVLPTFLYGIYYITNILIHMENGKVSPIYDWYWFVQNGVWTAIIVVPIIFLISYLISLILWRCNHIKFRY